MSQEAVKLLEAILRHLKGLKSALDDRNGLIPSLEDFLRNVSLK